MHCVIYLHWPRTWLEGHQLGSCDGIGKGLFLLKIRLLDGSHPKIVKARRSWVIFIIFPMKLFVKWAASSSDLFQVTHWADSESGTFAMWFNDALTNRLYLKMGFSVVDKVLIVWKPTIFFFCLDPSLHTKTTAVLKTKKQWGKHQLSWKGNYVIYIILITSSRWNSSWTYQM